MTEREHPIVDRGGTPDFFADGGLMLNLSNGVVRIAFSRLDPDLKGGLQTTVVGRVALPVDGAHTLANSLLAFLAQQDSAAQQGEAAEPARAFDIGDF